MIVRKGFFIFLIFIVFQNGNLEAQLNAIQTSVPFLTIAPDSRSGGMGDVGAATSPDVSSQHWNPAKFAFIEGKGGVGISYSPWLRNLIGDINLAYLSGYYRFDDKQVISSSLTYFSLGNINFTDEYGNTTMNFNPNEFSFDVGYSRAFSDYISGGLVFRYIYSNLTGGTTVGGAETKPGMAVAADIATYYNHPIKISGMDGNAGFGINISNIGTKISYTDDQDPNFIPTNLRIGGVFALDLDEYNSISLFADLNKLLVPTPPVYWQPGDTLEDGNIIQPGEQIIKAGKDPNVSVPVGMYQSFYDAPGGASEELHEIAFSIGLEYWYNKVFAIRGGYFYEHETKGNRKFFTVGLGLKLNVFSLDFAYLIPIQHNHPLSNTLRFTLAFDFDSFNKQ
ncbi:MAG: type IX secretion system outer membrane channel protein PorV [Bacteroidales bacterium]|nr:type IX secretion system outer membrane channel protein PorV [Bacteroidales bacterium]